MQDTTNLGSALGFGRSSRGAGLVEYALIIVAVMVLGGGAYRQLGGRAGRAATRTTACLAADDCGATRGVPRSGSYGATVAGDAVSTTAPAVETDEQIVARLVKKLQSGQRLTEEELATLQRIGEKTDKGLLTASAGASIQLKQADGQLVKASAEANTDKGAFVGVKRGTSRALGRVKVDMFGEATTNGVGKLATQEETTVVRRGPATLAVGAEQSLAGGSGASAYAKASVGATAKTPGGDVKVEAYVKLAANKLTPEESSSLLARMATRAVAMGNERARRNALLEVNRARVKSGLPPVTALPDGPP